MKQQKAIVLLSGGLDSATVLAVASRDFDCHAISFDYSQRHVSELQAAERLAQAFQAYHQVIHLDQGVMTNSALTEMTMGVPVDGPTEGIPVTYVPARNTIFLAHALAVAEVQAASDIFIGVNAVDYSGYPDCRPAYIEAFERMANLATRAAIEGHQLKIHAPLIHMSKAEIITTGADLGVDYSMTVSCYQADEQGRACGRCDSCRLRREGFEASGLEDPTRYQ
ncbi:MAG: 7-cyano-7-deazaguanine synthase QueC [Thiotrichales bacterium]|nr:MAG: 7-cyano-7-deazaguanine synthase QueC [Thiotrichales bacterium]